MLYGDSDRGWLLLCVHESFQIVEFNDRGWETLRLIKGGIKPKTLSHKMKLSGHRLSVYVFDAGDLALRDNRSREECDPEVVAALFLSITGMKCRR
jgi:hypothetical protein